jgi:xyloglucan:xyloglucosyl transferase
MKMASGFGLVILCLTSVVISAAEYQKFDDEFNFNFGQFNTKEITPYEAKLSLTNASGSGFQSKVGYLYGYIAMALKLPTGDAAGNVVSYYLSSTYSKHCELDFEFLGNKSGQPWGLQTNVFVEGVGDREQRINLWFDPTTKFHNYGILWNKAQIVFFVDTTVIRVFKNAVKLGVPYLDYQEMYSFSSIWNGESWATRGGRDKIDWSAAPFNAYYTDFNIEACPVPNGSTSAKHVCYHKLYTQPYGNAANQTLTPQQVADLKFIKTKWLIYDYCSDKTRWTVQPAECAINWPA